MAENKGFIAVHCGAGYHKKSLHPKYKKLCRKACTAAGEILNSGGSALDACQVAVMILEDHPIANAGYGSNLTYSGAVECDASIMDGKTLNFGACGAVRGVKYPIALASQICKNQSTEGPLGLVPPSLLVGPGAYDYAKLNNVLIVIDDQKLVAKRALLKHRKHKRLLHKTLNNSVTRFFPAERLDTVGERLETVGERLDTVGAVCVDSTGHVSAASSSGGIFLKYDGRVGQAATYACGAWADSFNNTNNNSVAVTTTGTGEYLVRTMLAKELADGINNSSCPVTAFQKTFRDKFLDSRYLKNIAAQKLAGALVVNVTPTGEGDFMWGHSTKSMAFAYLDTSTTTPKSMVSELPDELIGQSLFVSGVSFKLNS